MNRRNRRAIANSVWWLLGGPVPVGVITAVAEGLNIAPSEPVDPINLALIAAFAFWGLSWFGIFFYWMRRFVEGNDSNPDSIAPEVKEP